MSIRDDVTIDWTGDPRVLTVAAPSVEITIQDIVDTCRNFEDSPEGMFHPRLIDAAGKEFLGGTTYVGITATFQNCVLAFEARAGPSWILCTITGGNIVAVDETQTIIDPRLPTAYTTIDRTASASATLQEQEALQHSSYNGGVTVDLTSSYSGTDYPVGTPQEPVNNFADALTIASTRGFGTLFIIGDATLDSSNDFSNMGIIGESMTRTEVTVDADATTTGCEFYDCTLTGTLDGNAMAKNCVITTLSYITGNIEQCVLETGTTTLGGSAEAHFLDCWSGVAGTGTPIIDLGGSGQELSIRNYNGGVKLKNKTGADNVSIDLASGQIVLENTVTNGTIVARGVGKLIDTSGDTISTGTWNGVTIVNELIQPRLDDLDGGITGLKGMVVALDD